MSDAKGIAEVLKSSYNIKTINEGVQVFKSEVKKNHNFIVAVNNDKIIGLASWHMQGLPKHQLAELDRIALLPEYRGKGISKKIFYFVLNNMKKKYKKDKSRIRKIYLLTHASNKRAQKFYEKLGMKHEATLKNHYYENEDEYVYSIFMKRG